jgi:DNA invertase Pin-like site-specific DNA recombinase
MAAGNCCSKYLINWQKEYRRSHLCDWRYLKLYSVFELYIKDFSRLARSTKDLLSIVELFKKKNIKLVSLNENLDTNTPTGILMLTMIAAINEFERNNLLERQREGIAIAKQKSKYKGRKKINYPKNWEEIYTKWKNRELKGNEAMEKLDLKRNTFYKLVSEYEGEG